MSQIIKTVTASNMPFSPNSVVELTDDFIGVTFPDPSFIMESALSWYTNGAFNAVPSQDIYDENSTHPGVITTNFNSNPAPQSFNLMLGGNNPSFNTNFILGGGVISMNWVMKILTLSNSTNRYVLSFGFGDSMVYGGSIPTNGVYFNYSDNVNSGNWQVVTANASTYTTTNTSIAATISGFHNFGMNINAAASSVTFTIDGTSVGTISTNIPTSTGLTPFILLNLTAGTFADGQPLAIDLFYLQQLLTTAR